MEKIRKYLIPAAVVTLLAIDPALAMSETTERDLAGDIEAAALAEIVATGAPSLQIAIGSGNEVIHEAAFGLADIENEVRATTESRYRAASIAKWFTAAATMRLAEAGTLDLDEPVQTWCACYPRKRWPITSRQLLAHTSGIWHYLDHEETLAVHSSEPCLKGR